MPPRTAGITGALLVAFLTAALAPCPERVEIGDAQARVARARGAAAAATTPAHSHADEHDAAGLSLAAPCPCGCERVPVAAGSARLGAMLPSSSALPVASVAATPILAFAAHALDGFAPSIEHVPLLESL